MRTEDQKKLQNNRRSRYVIHTKEVHTRTNTPKQPRIPTSIHQIEPQSKKDRSTTRVKETTSIVTYE